VLYQQLRNVGLDSARVYHVRETSWDRSSIHFTFHDGTIAFTENVAGRITGALFEGEGEVLLMPPDQVERASLALFTGTAILEERFTDAYFRFNDDSYLQLQPFLRSEDNGAEFVRRWNEAARNLAQTDGLRLFTTFCRFLPTKSVHTPPAAPALSSPLEAEGDDHMFAAHLNSVSRGVFDLHYDSLAPEQIWAGQTKTVAGQSYYDVWTSFSLNRGSSKGLEAEADALSDVDGKAGGDVVQVTSYKIRLDVSPPSEIEADAVLHLEVRQGGQRALLFELSRVLRMKRVEMDGEAIEFIHNPTLEGTRLARQGDDIVALVFPEPLSTGRRLELRFIYSGGVLSDAGGGLLYVGERGLWYPSRGLAMAKFDLEFHYPKGWTLVATGRQEAASSSSDGSSATSAGPELVTRWVSERPIPLAGFNLGRFVHATAHAGAVPITAYATTGVEREFPRAEAPGESANPTFLPGGRHRRITEPEEQPSPARNVQQVANRSAQAVDFLARLFGPFPYAQLAITQVPGIVSQGWPSLVYLSTFSFLTPEESARFERDSVGSKQTSAVVVHEVAHQWWGDLVTWSGYRDQWMMEALANYTSLMLLESEDPASFRAVMQKYRDDLLQKNSSEGVLREAGPVTLGVRLSSSKFPNGYEAISYGRGTWLFHMLRTLLRDRQQTSDDKHSGKRDAAREDDAFTAGLRRVRERFEGRSLSALELFRVMEEQLPAASRYHGQKSLQWFYQGWVNGTAVPTLALHNVKYAGGSDGDWVSGTILQTLAPDDLVTSVPVYASVSGKNIWLGRVFVDGPEAQFRLRAPRGTRKVVLDPEQTLLAHVR
jgi:hypothetical protein